MLTASTKRDADTNNGSNSCSTCVWCMMDDIYIYIYIHVNTYLQCSTRSAPHPDGLCTGFLNAPLLAMQALRTAGKRQRIAASYKHGKPLACNDAYTLSLSPSRATCGAISSPLPAPVAVGACKIRLLRLSRSLKINPLQSIHSWRCARTSLIRQQQLLQHC